MSVNTSIIVRATAKGLPSGIIRSTITRRAARYTLNPSSENLFEKVSEGGLEYSSRGFFPRVVKSPAACSSAAKTGEIPPASVPERGPDPVLR
jgi:hypothetical protein